MKQQHFEFELEALTPVTIGGGDQTGLSPYTDYVIREGTLYYLDPEELLTYMWDRPEAVDRWTRALLRGMENMRSRFDLFRFLDEELEVHPEDVCYHKVPIKGIEENERLHLRTVQKTNGKPFIPGSSLKGTFRAALMWEWLIKDVAGRQALKHLLWTIQTAGGKRDVQRVARQIENQLFGDMMGDKRTDANRLRFGDASPIELKHLVVLPASRHHVEADRNSIPVPTEAI